MKEKTIKHLHELEEKWSMQNATEEEILEALICIKAMRNQNKTFPKDLEYIQRVANDAINKAVGKE